MKLLQNTLKITDNQQAAILMRSNQWMEVLLTGPTETSFSAQRNSELA